MPYLEKIDANRWYTNRGELVNALEARLDELLGATAPAGADSTRAMTAASGTAALEGAILATAGRATSRRPLAILPAYTFIATALAVEACGYTPYLVDVDATTWALDARRLIENPILERAGVVVPVAPYGRSVAQDGWVAFSIQTKISVVIDAAAAFEQVIADPRCRGSIPVALSFQATKVFSSAEGGAVIWSDADGLMRVARSLNFGMLGKRECSAAGTNGKMSEYHAAVGLASLDEYDTTASRNRTVALAYRTAARAYGLDERLYVAPDVASNYALIDAGSPSAGDAVVAALEAEKIESRRWYGCGLQHEAYLVEALHDPLPETERIAPSLIGLPMYSDITPKDIERTLRAVASVMARARDVPPLVGSKAAPR